MKKEFVDIGIPRGKNLSDVIQKSLLGLTAACCFALPSDAFAMDVYNPNINGNHGVMKSSGFSKNVSMLESVRETNLFKQNFGEDALKEHQVDYNTMQDLNTLYKLTKGYESELSEVHNKPEKFKDVKQSGLLKTVANAINGTMSDHDKAQRYNLVAGLIDTIGVLSDKKDLLNNFPNQFVQEYWKEKVQSDHSSVKLKQGRLLTAVDSKQSERQLGLRKIEIDAVMHEIKPIDVRSLGGATSTTYQFSDEVIDLKKCLLKIVGNNENEVNYKLFLDLLNLYNKYIDGNVVVKEKLDKRYNDSIKNKPESKIFNEVVGNPFVVSLLTKGLSGEICDYLTKAYRDCDLRLYISNQVLIKGMEDFIEDCFFDNQIENKKAYVGAEINKISEGLLKKLTNFNFMIVCNGDDNKPKGQGTGFYYEKNLVTVAHVINQCSSIEVFDSSSQRLNKLTNYDESVLFYYEDQYLLSKNSILLLLNEEKQSIENSIKKQNENKEINMNHDALKENMDFLQGVLDKKIKKYQDVFSNVFDSVGLCGLYEKNKNQENYCAKALFDFAVIKKDITVDSLPEGVTIKINKESVIKTEDINNRNIYAVGYGRSGKYRGGQHKGDVLIAVKLEGFESVFDNSGERLMGDKKKAIQVFRTSSQLIPGMSGGAVFTIQDDNIEIFGNNVFGGITNSYIIRNTNF